MVKFGFMSIAHMHAFSYGEVLNNLPGAELVGIFDLDHARGTLGAKKMSTSFFADASDLLKQVDAVIICSENSLHREYTELAASHGVHVLCEKPIATNLEDAKSMIDVCEKAGVKLQIAFPVRFNTPVRRVKEMLEREAIGDILAIRGTNHGKMPGSWFVDPKLAGGGAIMDHTVHVVDIIRWLMGKEFTSVFAEVDNLLYDVDIDDCGMLSMELEGGIFVTHDPSWSRPATFPTWGNVTLEIIGTDGVINLDAFAQNFLVYADKENRLMQKSFTEDMNYALITDFLEMIEENGEPSITGFDGLQALKVVLAAYKSSETKKPISLL